MKYLINRKCDRGECFIFKKRSTPTNTFDDLKYEVDLIHSADPLEIIPNDPGTWVQRILISGLSGKKGLVVDYNSKVDQLLVLQKTGEKKVFTCARCFSHAVWETVEKELRTRKTNVYLFPIPV